MSHIEEVKTELTDVAVLERAIVKLYGSLNKNETISSRWVGTHHVDYKLNSEFGLVKKDGSYTIFGDFYGTGTNKDRVLQELTQTYSEIKVEDSLFRKGFSVESRKVNRNGEVHITYSRRR